jgi:hypothetical protein
MNKTEEILKSKLKSKEKVSALVKAVKQKEVSAKEFEVVWVFYVLLNDHFKLFCPHPSVGSC